MSATDHDPQGRRGITVVMPALNEEKNVEAALADTLRAFDDMRLDGEILLVNDGSTDRTEAIARSVADRDPRVRVLRHERNRGMGASWWDGVDAATKDAVIMLPGDNENDPWECFRYLDLLDHVDLIVPFVFNRSARSRLRNLLSYTYQAIINWSFGSFFNYTNGTVVYRRSVLKDLETRGTGFFYQTDTLIRLTRKRGYLFAEVPYRLRRRREGKSKATTLASLLRLTKEYARLVKDYYFGKTPQGGVRYPNDSATARRRAEAE